MKSYKSQFEDWQKKRPNVGDIPNFAAAITGTNMRRDTMRRLFNRLVDPADYEGVQKKVLLDWLDRLTHAPFPHRKSAKNAPSTTGKAQDKESSV